MSQSENLEVRKQIPVFADKDIFFTLETSIQERVLELLYSIQKKGIMGATPTEAETLLNLQVISGEYKDIFENVLTDPRTQEEKETDIRRATEKIFG